MTLSGESASAQLATDPTATGTIVDDDAAPIVVTPSADALVSNVGQSQSPFYCVTFLQSGRPKVLGYLGKESSVEHHVVDEVWRLGQPRYMARRRFSS